MHARALEPSKKAPAKGPDRISIRPNSRNRTGSADSTQIGDQAQAVDRRDGRRPGAPLMHRLGPKANSIAPQEDYGVHAAIAADPSR